MRFGVVTRQPWQRRLCASIPEPPQLEIVFQRLVEQLDPAVFRFQIAAGNAHQHLCVPDPHHLVFAFRQRRRTLLIEQVDALEQRLGEASLVDQDARGQEPQQLWIDHCEGRFGVDEGVEPGAVERARHPQRGSRATLADAGHVPIAGELEVAPRSRAVKDDRVATMVDGQRLDDLGERLCFVHGRIHACQPLPLFA